MVTDGDGVTTDCGASKGSGVVTNGDGVTSDSTSSLRPFTCFPFFFSEVDCWRRWCGD